MKTVVLFERGNCKVKYSIKTESKPRETIFKQLDKFKAMT